MRRELVLALAALCCASPRFAAGKTIDMSPQPAVLLQSNERVVVQDALDGVAVYDRTGAALHKFGAGGSYVTTFAVTSDETCVLLACDDGSLRMFDLRTGAGLWAKPGTATGLSFVYDVSFAWDGASFVACGYADGALVFDTATGAPRGAGRFRPGDGMPMSAALSPDGATGALVDLGTPGRVFTFDVASGRLTDTGLTGTHPLRISSDGRHLAFRSGELGTGLWLHVAPLPNPSPATLARVAWFRQVDHIRPTADGCFNVSALTAADGATLPSKMVAAVCDPRTGGLRHVWEMAAPTRELIRMDFDATAMVGVSTRFDLRTTVTDIKAGVPRLVIDNTGAYAAGVAAAEARVAAADMIAARPSPTWLLGTAGAILATLFAGAALFARRRRLPPA